MLRAALCLNRMMLFGAVLLIAGGITHAEVKKPQSKTPEKKPVATAKSSHTVHHVSHSRRRRSTRRRKASWRRGQQHVAPERAEEIQQALIRAHYLQGKPSGKWDEATQSALRKYQADHDWQTKVVPDSRALISLGLGPGREHLLNPDSAMTTAPSQHSVPASTPLTPVSTPATPASTPAGVGDPPPTSNGPEK